MNWDSTPEQSESIFAVRGSLDGDKATEDFSEKVQFIGALIGQEEFLLPVPAISEIIMLKPITFVPQAAPYIEGVINLRGTIVAALNLRKMMGLPRTEATAATRIIIVRHEEASVGMVVDGITYVIALNDSDIERQTLYSHSTGADLLSGISKRGDKINGVLDPARIIAAAAGGKLDIGDNGA